MAKKKENISGVSKELSQAIKKNINKERKRIDFPLKEVGIGISVSESEEFLELGFSDMHLKDITIELTRYLLVNGAKLVYGGDLRQGGYTFIFSELAFQYRKQGNSDDRYFINYFPWPTYLQLSNVDLAQFKKNRVEIVRVPCVNESLSDQWTAEGFSENPENQKLLAECISSMRAEMAQGTFGRIFIGGRLSDFRGFLPGILEEAFIAAQKKQPLYLVGAFGGATGFLIRAIKGERSDSLANELIDTFPPWRDLGQKDVKRNYKSKIKKVFDFFKDMGANGLSELNGLSIERNNILFDSVHVQEIIYHILDGLKSKVK
ncbi:hypothetical protein [Chitinophaga varians]|uniref:hypothetical protein n=1 Tax=Chitinophaga varians TaxID=2202339 RepID=UPI00165F1133|nr:hypothetical protein [Chitinophaga varians]MBC9911040.1 hypothetical protein [Chitinophaga varians]